VVPGSFQIKVFPIKLKPPPPKEKPGEQYGTVSVFSEPDNTMPADKREKRE